MGFESHGQGTPHLLGGFAVLLHAKASFPPPVQLGLELSNKTLVRPRGIDLPGSQITETG